MKEVAIIGAGLSGLICGAFLSKKGFKVDIYEKSSEIGGRATPLHKDGFSLDFGIHLIRNGEKGFLSTAMADLGEKLDLILLEKPEVVYFENGDFIPLPADKNELLATPFLSFEEKVAIYTEVIKGNLDERMKMPLIDWVKEVKGSKKLEKFMSISALGIVCPFIGMASTGELFSFLRRKISMGSFPSGLPYGGFFTVLEKLTKIIKSHNGEIHTNINVKKINIENGKAIGIQINDEIIKKDIVVCAFPLQNLFNRNINLLTDFSQVENNATKVAGKPFDILIDENLINAEKVSLLKNLKPTSGIVIDFALRKKITDLNKIIVNMEEPFFMGSAISNLEPSLAPLNHQLITFTIITREKKNSINTNNRECHSCESRNPPNFQIPAHAGMTEVVQFESKIDEIFPTLKENLLWKRVLHLPVINGVQLNYKQNIHNRPTPDFLGIEGLFLAGDSLCGEGSGGDLSVTSARLCVKKIISRI